MARRILLEVVLPVAAAAGASALVIGLGSWAVRDWWFVLEIAVIALVVLGIRFVMRERAKS
jgi:hypothetical protein